MQAARLHEQTHTLDHQHEPRHYGGMTEGENAAGRAWARGRRVHASWGAGIAGSLGKMRPTEVEAAWAALAGASACLGGIILDRSGTLDDGIDEPERTRVKAALLDARVARDALTDELHREALRLGIALFDLDPDREYGSMPELRVVVRDGLAGADGLADVLSLDDGALLPLASRLRDGFEAVAQALPGN
jgi:hypothetical protein